jgi:hypothetical protein
VWWYFRMTRSVALAAVIPAIFIAGCSGDGKDGPPQCSDVWEDGQTLPEDYDGCLSGDSFEVAPIWDCIDGSQATGFRTASTLPSVAPSTRATGRKASIPRTSRCSPPALVRPDVATGGDLEVSGKPLS